jgi:hypothetical protein
VLPAGAEPRCLLLLDAVARAGPRAAALRTSVACQCVTRAAGAVGMGPIPRVTGRVRWAQSAPGAPACSNGRLPPAACLPTSATLPPDGRTASPSRLFYRAARGVPPRHPARAQALLFVPAERVGGPGHACLGRRPCRWAPQPCHLVRVSGSVTAQRSRRQRRALLLLIRPSVVACPRPFCDPPAKRTACPSRLFYRPARGVPSSCGSALRERLFHRAALCVPQEHEPCCSPQRTLLATLATHALGAAVLRGPATLSPAGRAPPAACLTPAEPPCGSSIAPPEACPPPADPPVGRCLPSPLLRPARRTDCLPPRLFYRAARGVPSAGASAPRSPFPDPAKEVPGAPACSNSDLSPSACRRNASRAVRRSGPCWRPGHACLGGRPCREAPQPSLWLDGHRPRRAAGAQALPPAAAERVGGPGHACLGGRRAAGPRHPLSCRTGTARGVPYSCGSALRERLFYRAARGAPPACGSTRRSLLAIRWTACPRGSSMVPPAACLPLSATLPRTDGAPCSSQPGHRARCQPGGPVAGHRWNGKRVAPYRGADHNASQRA